MMAHVWYFGRPLGFAEFWKEGFETKFKKHFVKNKHKKFTLSNPSKMISTQCVRASAPSEYCMLLLVFKICFGGKVIHLSSCK